MPRLSASVAGAVMSLDEGHEFLHQEILVALASVARIDEEGAVPIGRDDQEFADLLLIPQILNQIPAARVEQGLLILAETVQEIEHGIAARLLRIVAGRQQHAIRTTATCENLARDRTAFRAAGGVRGDRTTSASRERRAQSQAQSLFISQGLDGIEPRRARCGIHSGDEAHED